MTQVVSKQSQEWPGHSDYKNVMQNPGFAFRGTSLADCSIEKDSQGQPRPRCGNFAIVFKAMLSGGGVQALRVFHKQSDERRERYRSVSNYLEGLKKKKQIPETLVHFEYQEGGIRVSTSTGVKRFPLITMDWVPGDDLYKWLQSRSQSNHTTEIRNLADRWVDVIADLERREIAHGDLQHGNILVDDQGRIILVDYDGMCVPELVGLPNLEVGLPAYQHPLRMQQEVDLFSGIDRFSAIVIFLSLRALSVNPKLWNEFVEPDGQPANENILLRSEDLNAPDQSKLLKQLRSCKDEHVRKIADALRDCLNLKRLEEIPPLSDLAFDFEPVHHLLSKKDFDAAIELLNRTRMPVPPAMQKEVGTAQARVNCRRELEDAIKRGDEKTMQSLSQSELLRDYPSAGNSLAFAKKAANVIRILDELSGFLDRGDGRSAVECWQKNQSLLSGRNSSKKFQTQIDKWILRNSLCDQLLRVAKQTTHDGAGVREALKKLDVLGGHPEIDRYRQELNLLVERHDALQVLLRAGHDATLEHDQVLTTGWNENLFAGWSPAENYRSHYETSKKRLQLYQSLRNSIAQAQTTRSIQSEENLFVQAKGLPADYDSQISQRVQQARMSLQAVRAARNAFAHKPLVEAELAEAWKSISAASATDLLSPVEVERLQLAANRLPLLNTLQTIPLDLPLDRRDENLLNVWNEALLSRCSEAAPWRDAWSEAVKRKSLLNELREALDTKNEARIAELYESPLLTGYPLPSVDQRQIQDAQKAMVAAKKLVTILKDNNRREFVQNFDARVLSRYTNLFMPYESQLLEWIKQDLRSPEILGLRGQQGAIRRQASFGSRSQKFEIRWSWPEPRFSDRCQVSICRKHPRPDAVPDMQNDLLTGPVDRRSYEAAGGCKTLPLSGPPAKWERCYVVVWSLIETGESTLFSQPVVLGRLSASGGK